MLNKRSEVNIKYRIKNKKINKPYIKIFNLIQNKLLHDLKTHPPYIKLCEEAILQNPKVINFLDVFKDFLLEIYPQDMAEKCLQETKSKISLLWQINDDLVWDLDFDIYWQVKIKIIDDFVFEHRTSLKRDFKSKIQFDVYGIEEDNGWIKLLEKIYSKKIQPEIERKFLWFKGLLPKEYTSINTVSFFSSMPDNTEIDFFDKMIRSRIEFCANNQENSLDDCDIYDGHSYETIICSMINDKTSSEWQAHRTSGSGDQGADVIIDNKYHDIRIVVQCKYYSQPVGNKAVQEVLGAKTYYEATQAFVVTNSTFTKSAQNLAQKANVDLLHQDMLIERINEI